MDMYLLDSIVYTSWVYSLKCTIKINIFENNIHPVKFILYVCKRILVTYIWSEELMRSSCFGLRSHHLLYLGDRDKKTTIYIDFNLPSFFLNFTHSLDSLSKSISILVICLPWLKIPGVLKCKPLKQFIFLVE